MDIPTVPGELTAATDHVANIDVPYSLQPEFAVLYSIDMYDYFNNVEDAFRPSHNYLSRQTAINADQRAYLVNAMVNAIHR